METVFSRLLQAGTLIFGSHLCLYSFTEISWLQGEQLFSSRLHVYQSIRHECSSSGPSGPNHRSSSSGKTQSAPPAGSKHTLPAAPSGCVSVALQTGSSCPHHRWFQQQGQNCVPGAAHRHCRVSAQLWLMNFRELDSYLFLFFPVKSLPADLKSQRSSWLEIWPWGKLAWLIGKPRHGSFMMRSSGNRYLEVHFKKTQKRVHVQSSRSIHKNFLSAMNISKISQIKRWNM